MGRKVTTQFVCQNCGNRVVQWMGKCTHCQQWNTFVQEESAPELSAKGSAKSRGDGVPLPISEVMLEEIPRFSTGIGEFDRVLGGGLVPGSLVLIGGEPGVGKSTLVLEATKRVGQKYDKEKILYVSGEESMQQVASRGRRLGMEGQNVYLHHQTLWEDILVQLKKIRPALFILDSIQTTVAMEIPSPPGSLSQIRDVTYEIMNYSKAYGTTSIVVGHVTKEGTMAGPKTLEHMVDTVVYFEGDQFGHYRLLRASKNRFGNANEVGIFEMTDKGLNEVPNPSLYFLDQSDKSVYGKTLTCLIEGSRTLMVELQALVVENKYGNGRRATFGVDTNRLALLVAVIEKYFGIQLHFNDIYVNVAGGLKLQKRESDLAIVAALLSSLKARPVEGTTVLLGEVGLTGEVLPVTMAQMRLKEISQLNYKRVITSKRVALESEGKFPIEIIGINKAFELEQILFS